MRALLVPDEELVLLILQGSEELCGAISTLWADLIPGQCEELTHFGKLEGFAVEVPLSFQHAVI